MAKAGARPGTRSDGSTTREKIVAASIETLSAEGFAGTSARSIAARGKFNQALIFYHFGSVNDLLVTALADISKRRMEDYSATLAEVDSLGELVTTARSIFYDDLDRGYVKVLSEMISGASTFPELGPRIWKEIEPWVAFTEAALSRVVSSSPLDGILPVPDVAYGIVALYLGIELLAQLNGERGHVESLFGTADQVTRLISSLLQVKSSGAGRSK